MKLLTKKDLLEQIPYWKEDTINKLFNNPKFPAQKQGKTHFVEEDALKEYFKVHHDSLRI